MELSGRVLITGGAGFLARAIYRRAEADGWDCRFTALSRGDATHAALARRFPRVRTIRADVADDPDFLAAAFRGHDVVIHAAATKYVDLAEAAAYNTARVNVLGSMNVLNAALRAGVERVLAISTDKACAPVNVYGMSKAVMERLFQEAGQLAGDATFVACRYGNVIGSAGSVIPMFERQLAELGRAKITNPDMTRFWMGVDEAIDLILFSLYQAPSGTVVIPEPRAMTILDVVRAIAGEADPAVEYIGERPGEKRHEALLHAQESVRAVEATSKPGSWGTAYYLLHPPGPPPPGAVAVPFELTSDAPAGGWMPPEEMRELARDAALI